MGSIKLNVSANLIRETTIVSYSLDCPYCFRNRIYRFLDSALPSTTKCKCCKKDFLLNYDFYEMEENEYDVVIFKCKKCGKHESYTQLGYQDNKCNCGSEMFETINVDLNGNELK